MSQSNTSELAFKSSIRRHLWFSLCAVVVLVGGIGGWAAFTKISGAVVASGAIVVESNSKQVQHQEGGIIQKLFVRNGDVVESGDILARMDDTVTKADLAIVNGQLAQLYAIRARLEAERQNQSDPAFDDIAKDLIHPASFKNILTDELELLQARMSSREARRSQLDEQINQFEQQIEGYLAQKAATDEELSLIDADLTELQDLLEKKLVQKTRVTNLRRDRSELMGTAGELTARIAQARQSIAEKKIQILQLEDDFQAEVLSELQQNRARIVQLEEQKTTAEDKLTRMDIRAPRAGFVHQLNVHTEGGVIAPGETLMLIVPNGDRLLAEVQIRPVDINQLHVGQNARVRFPSFDQKSTPELAGKLTIISADLTQDPNTGMTYYTGRLEIPEDELAKLDGKQLIPGMPVETFTQTNERTVLSYLVKPIRDQIAHALRER